MATIATLQENVKYNLGRDDANIDTLTLRWLNDARADVLRQADTVWLGFLENEAPPISVVQGQQDYDLDTITDLGEILMVRLANAADNTRIPLRRMTFREAEAVIEYVDADREGKPEAYFIFGSTPTLYLLPPKPDASTYSLLIKYSNVLSAYTSGTDTDMLTQRYPEVLEAGATALGYRYFGDTEQYRLWWQDYLMMRAEMLLKEKARQFSGAKLAVRPHPKDIIGIDPTETPIREDF